jgi:thiamine transport system ATP-binding protein
MVSTVDSAGLQVRGLTIGYQGRTLIDGLDLDVATGEIVALLGPSGSGKSSLLRCIAGVQSPESGSIRWDGQDITAVPAHRRGIGLVFQDALLFPHRDVAGNVGFGLTPSSLTATRRATFGTESGPPRSSQRDRDARVSELLALVGLPGFESRHVSTLSGGEAQRVALARALAPRPRLLLLDEPFGALDRDLRDRLAGDVRRLLLEAGIPALHVTHDRQEAALVADRILHLPTTGGETYSP